VIVDCVKDGIKYLVILEGRLMKFTEMAKNLQLSSKKLILDVRTRRNNTYLMLAADPEFREDWDKVEIYVSTLGSLQPSNKDCIRE
jgi:hypothetical protein